jgi:hypothetical protein
MEKLLQSRGTSTGHDDPTVAYVPRRARARWWVAAALIAVLLAGGVWALWYYFLRGGP